MSIDYQSVITQLTVFFKGLFIAQLPIVEQTAATYLANTEARLLALSKNALSGDLTKDEVLAALKAEPAIALSEMNSFEVAGLSIAQDAINNVQTVLSNIFTSAVVVTPTQK